jgi:tRNA threonylcarbamoyladenosine biosynthesis protein TsaB
MRLLALDAATEACSVALLDGNELLSRHAELGRPHAQQILSMVDAVLAHARVSLTDLDGIAASIGPGAFTGVRISVAVAQGLAFGSGLPVVPVSTLEALAFQVIRRGASPALACLDARMGEVYWGCFTADAQRGVAAQGAARVGPPASVVLPQGATYAGIGRGFAAYPSLAGLPGLAVDARLGQALPHAEEFARLAALRLARGEGIDPAALSPLYIRDKVALTEAERAAR